MTAAKLIDDPEALGVCAIGEPTPFEKTGLPTLDALLEQIRWNVPEREILRAHFQRVASGDIKPELQSLAAILASKAMVVLIDLSDTRHP
jgi:hypothetical protein